MKKRYYDVYGIVDNHAKYKDVQSTCIKRTSLKTAPVLTIGIPTCNREELLRETIDSALNQQCQIDYEVMVVDNNPMRNDETERMIKQYYENEPRLSYYKNQENIGMVGNWNRLYEIAKGDWVMMLHDDDVLYPYAVNTAMKVVSKETNLDVLFLWHTLDKEYIPISTPHNYYIKLKPYDFRMDNWGDVLGTIIKKDTAIQLGGFNEDYYPSHDFHFWSLLSLNSNVYRIMGDPLGYYRIGVNLSLKLSTLDGELKFDRIIMNGLTEIKPWGSLRMFFFNKYMQRYLYNYTKSWVGIFYKDGDKNKVEEIERKHGLYDDFTSKVVRNIYGTIHRISMRMRKHHSII